MLADPGDDPQEGKRPGQEAEHAEEDAGREAAEDEDQEHGGHQQVDALDKE